MKIGLYPRLAFTSIRNNKKVYVPYMLTAAGMMMMFYLISFIAVDPGIGSLQKGWYFQLFLNFGRVIIGLFACIFLFYTNSFLVRRRKKEFGLYNMLGMGKGNLVKILFWETLIIAAVTIVGGVLTGLLFSRGVQLLISRFMGEGQMVAYQVLPKLMQGTVLLFALLFLLLFIYGARQIYKAKPIELFRSEAEGEKPPKANWLLALLGLGLLGAGYFISTTLAAPFTMEKLAIMTLAIGLVIMATYVLFIAGSVVFCRFLQKNKSYYYKTNHFVSVSSMIYRMKKNGAGLATICVLSIMVLVILSTTVCLYVGKEDALRQMYPRDIVVDIGITPQREHLDEGFFQTIHQEVAKVVAEKGVKMEAVLDYRPIELNAGLVGDQLFITRDSQAINFNNIVQIYVISLEDYNRLIGTKEFLGEKEVLLHVQKANFPYSRLAIEGYEELAIIKQVEQIPENGKGYTSIYPFLYVVAAQSEKAKLEGFLLEKGQGDQVLWGLSDYYAFNLPLEPKEQIKVEEEIRHRIEAITQEGNEGFSVKIRGVASQREEIYGMYGAIMLLGVFLSVVFLMATVLTMYYKQVTEGYEDQKRYDIMQKVGMTPKEVKKTINSQVLTVFFLPLGMAGLHLMAAFPMIKLVLEVIGVMNRGLLIQITLMSFLVFALFYVMMYKVTSKAYYNIVSMKE